MVLIDVKKLIDHCFDTIREFQKQDEDIVADAIRKNILWYILNMDSVDAVPLVQCKDCIGKSTWYKNESSGEFYICGMSGMYIVKDTDYCSYGERKENRETNDGQSQG